MASLPALARLLSSGEPSATLHPAPLTTNEALSGIFGSISLAAWIFVLVPQLYQNWKHSDASGISLSFLTVWLIGDITNLAGAIWASLVPTVIVLAIYYCFADAVLIAQVVYYNYIYRGQHLRTTSRAGADMEPDEEEPLLSRRESGASSIGLPGSHKRRRRRSSALSDGALARTSIDEGAHVLGKILEDEVETTAKQEWIKNTAALLMICFIGTLGWYICYATGLWIPAAPPSPSPAEYLGKTNSTPLGAEFLGYFSAVAYLGARLPQIWKNWRDQSCEGLSLLFFLLSMWGNLTYGAGILFHSTEREYVLTNLPWLIGSLGTIAEDLTIFVQFKLYSDAKRANEEAVE